MGHFLIIIRLLNLNLLLIIIIIIAISIIRLIVKGLNNIILIIMLKGLGLNIIV